MFLRKPGIQRRVAAALMLLTAVCARAEPVEVAVSARTDSQSFDQVLYKGVVGNMLETVPLDPQRRVELQRANAVISNPVSARSLALLLGVASPVFLVGGLAWGIFAASRIKPAAQVTVAGSCGPDYSAALSTAPEPESVFPHDAQAAFSHGPLVAAQP